MSNIVFSGKRIPIKELLNIWQSITNKVFPNNRIIAFIMREDEFIKTHAALISAGVKSFDIEEYGKEMPFDGTEAFAILHKHDSGEQRFLIAINENAKVFSFDENLRHELQHIANGDVNFYETENINDE